MNPNFVKIILGVALAVCSQVVLNKVTPVARSTQE